MSRRHGKGNTPKLPVSPLSAQRSGSQGMGRCECPSPLSLRDSVVQDQTPPDESLPIPQHAKQAGMV